MSIAAKDGGIDARLDDGIRKYLRLPFRPGPTSIPDIGFTKAKNILGNTDVYFAIFGGSLSSVGVHQLPHHLHHQGWVVKV